MVSIKKPEIDNYVNFLHALLDDISIENGVKVNTTRDKATLKRRALHEGLSFFTVTLPRLGSALDSALKTGKFICPSNFRHYKQTALPCFTRGLLSSIFTSEGSIREDADLASISELRQLYYSFYKLEVPFSTTQLAEAEEKFKLNDSAISGVLHAIDEFSLPTRQVLRLAREFIADLFADFDYKDIVPAHGPGIVASGEKPHEKRIFSTKYRRIHEVYPYYSYFYINPNHLLHTKAGYTSRNVEDSGINKVIFVPKDSRGPRTIAAEPLEYQFLQQGLRKSLYRHIENHPLTRGRINFTDQTVNQALARRGSEGENIITIDLKDASDRVSADLVSYLFRDTSLLKALLALRTSRSELPSGQIVELNKYAAMGSALCFPVEALVFYSLIVGIQSLFESIEPFGYVYGDDIIVKKELYHSIVDIFSQIGLVVNDNKSSYTGFFRESCGAEYYLGHDVTYLKVRTMENSSPDGIAALFALSNNLFERCYYRAAKYIEGLLRKAKGLHSVPFGYKDSSYLNLYNVRSSPPPVKSRVRWNEKFQYEERKVPVVSGKNYSVSANGSLEEHAEYYRKVTQGWSPHFRPGCYVKRGCKIKQKYIQIGT